MEYLVKTGEDINSYTEKLQYGDIVLVEDGIYDTVLPKVSGVVYKSLNKYRAKIYKFYLFDVDYLQIVDFDIFGKNIEMAGSINKFCQFKGNKIHSDESTGIDFDTGEDNIVEGNEIYDVQGHGVHTSGATVRTIVRNNIIHDCESHGLGMVGGEGEKYLNNIIYNCGSTGIHPGSGEPINGEIRGNLVYGCGIHAIAVSGKNFLIENNTCIGKNGIDHQVYYVSGSGHKLRNNIGYRSDGLNFVLLIPTGAVSDYNCWYDPNNLKCISRWYNPVTLAELQKYGQDIHSISQDPKFVDILKSDFRLQEGSPCVGTAEDGKNMGTNIFDGGGQDMWNVTGVKIVMVAIGSISGVVVDEVGKPLVADVEASGPVVKTIQSALDGTFTITGLPAGIYALRGIKVGYKCDVQNITIGA